MYRKRNTPGLATLLISLLLLAGCGASSTNDEPMATPEPSHPDFSGIYDYRGGALMANGPCDGTINGAWGSGCYNFPFTEAGKASIPAELDGGVQCIPDGLVRLNMRTLYDIQFSHEDHTVVINYEFGPVERRIYTDGRTPAADQSLSRHGFSVGTWMGDMLYVETTHLEESYSFLLGGAHGDQVGGPIGPSTRIIERIWPGPTEGTLLHDMVIEDAVNYSAPFMVMRKEWTKTDATEIPPWDCVNTEDLFLDDNPDLDAFFAD